MKLVAGLFLAVAAFLVYAIIAGGASLLISVGYAFAAIALYLLAVRFWRGRPARVSAPTTAG
jgi:hypothetical protein